MFPSEGAFEASGRVWRGTAAGLQNGSYEVWALTPVSCAGDGGSTGYVACRFGVFISAPPEPPTNLASSSPDQRSVVLTWQPSPTERIAGYRLRRTGFGGGLAVIADLTADARSFTEIPPTGLPDQLTYSLASVDAFGQESLPVPVGITLDKTPPRIAITVGSPKVERNGVTHLKAATLVTITASDASGVASLTYNYNTGGGSFDPVPQDGQITFAGVADGPTTLTTIAEDALGNRSAPLTLAVVADNSPPSAALNLAASGIYASGSAFYLAAGHPIIVSATDTGVGVASVTASGATRTTLPATFDAFTGEGAQLFRFNAEDLLGNTSLEFTQELRVIATPPSSTLVSDANHSFGL